MSLGGTGLRGFLGGTGKKKQWRGGWRCWRGRGDGLRDEGRGEWSGRREESSGSELWGRASGKLVWKVLGRRGQGKGRSGKGIGRER